jgi:CDGSH-type Zn-finger protein
MSDVVIKVLKNGPLRVEGKVQMIDCNGNVMAFEKDKFSLCRCGHSSKKPFCDGTHNKIGFAHEDCFVPEPTPPAPAPTPIIPPKSE